VGQACALVTLALTTQSITLLMGLAIISGQLALRLSGAQMVAGLVMLQGLTGVAVGLITRTPWQVIGSLLLFGMVSAALVVPLISARRRFAQRSAAAALVRKLEREMAALTQRGNELRHAAIAAERHRVAREIHDGMGHYLMTIAIQIQVVEELLGDDPAAALRQLHNTGSLIREAQRHLYYSVDTLNPLPTGDDPLRCGLGLLAQQHNQRGSSTAKLSLEGELADLPADVALTLYRAAQEGLTNALKHGRATMIHISVTCWPSLVRLLVEDNGGTPLALPGKSAALQSSGYGLGLQGLRERAALLGGVCEAGPEPTRGFTLIVEIPLTQGLP
jgi:signal transduction histidine kinase